MGINDSPAALLTRRGQEGGNDRQTSSPFYQARLPHVPQRLQQPPRRPPIGVHEALCLQQGTRRVGVAAGPRAAGLRQHQLRRQLRSVVRIVVQQEAVVLQQLQGRGGTG